MYVLNWSMCACEEFLIFKKKIVCIQNKQYSTSNTVVTLITKLSVTSANQTTIKFNLGYFKTFSKKGM